VTGVQTCALPISREVVFGLLVVGFLVFEPRGLAQIWRRMKRKYEIWPFKT